MGFDRKPSILYLPFEAYKGSEPYLFVSYAHKDRDIIFPEIKYWHDLGFRIWYDEGIDPGADWTDAIATAINECFVFLVFISSRAVDSQNVRNEINLAIKRKKLFIAIHLEETNLTGGLELQISSFQALLKYELTDEQYRRRLERALPRAIKSEPQKLAPDSLISEEIIDGGAWRAIYKGNDWLCEDIVLTYLSEIYPVFLLADGATNANGLKAIKIAKEVFGKWLKSVQIDDLSDAKQALCKLIFSIHEKLLELEKQIGSSVITTAVAVAIYKGGTVPIVLILSYGNSGCLVTKEEVTNGSQLIYSTLLREPPPTLGSHSQSKIDPKEILVEIPLTKEGIYYVRAFSDGIGEDPLESVFGHGKGIRHIVSEATLWPNMYEQIGYDDWAVAGFDILVRKEQSNQ